MEVDLDWNCGVFPVPSTDLTIKSQLSLSHSIAPLRVVLVSIITSCSQAEVSKLSNANGCEILPDKDEIALIAVTACWDSPPSTSSPPINIVLTNQTLIPSNVVNESLGDAAAVTVGGGEFGTEWEVKELTNEVNLLKSFRDVVKALDPDVIAVSDITHSRPSHHSFLPGV